MQFLCHYCQEWYETNEAEEHFASSHNQPGMKFETLQNRLAALGVLFTREGPPAPDPQEKPRGNWLMGSETKARRFETNNFHHDLD